MSLFIYKRKDSPNWYLGGIVENGKRKAQSLHKFLNLSFPVTDRQTAELLLANLRMKEIKQELGIEQSNSVSVDQFYSEYFRFCDRNKTYNTIRGDKYRFKRWLKFLKLQHVTQIADIDKPLLSSFIQTCLNKIKNTTINTYITIIRASLEHAKRQGYLKENPLRDFPLMTRIPFTRPARFKSSDLRKLLSIPDKLFLIYLKVIYYTLMRRTEALNLKWSDIDFRRRTITLMQTKSKKPRTIPITQKLWRILKELPHEREKLFPWKQHSVTTKFRRLKKDLKLERIDGIHHLRHLRASELIRKGANPKAIQHALGHSTISTTLKIYVLEDIAGVREALGG